MNNVLTRGCMTSKGRALFDMINGTGGVNRTISSFLPNKSEIQDKENLKTGRNNARNQGDIPPMIAHATQGRRQDTQGANGTDDTLVSAERNVGDNNDSLTLQKDEKKWFDQYSGLGNSENLFNSQEYDRNVCGLSTGENAFWDFLPKEVRDFVQSDVGRSMSINGMDRPLDKEEWRSALEVSKRITLSQLTEAAAEIMGILSIVVGGAEIAAINITLGLCVVAQEVQEERKTEKERLEGLKDPKWDEAAIKAELERKVPIWFRNKAMEFFAGEWLGKIAKFITNDKLGRIVIDQSREPFLEWYKTMLEEWKEYEETMDAQSHIDSWTKSIKKEYKE